MVTDVLCNFSYQDWEKSKLDCGTSIHPGTLILFFSYFTKCLTSKEKQTKTTQIT